MSKPSKWALRLSADVYVNETITNKLENGAHTIDKDILARDDRLAEFLFFGMPHYPDLIDYQKKIAEFRKREESNDGT